jgi:hypothetical protein
MSSNLVVPVNLSVLPLPPKSLKFNAVEKLWLFMGENSLLNRIFQSHGDVGVHWSMTVLPMLFSEQLPLNGPPVKRTPSRHHFCMAVFDITQI